VPNWHEKLAQDGHDLILVARRESPMRDLAIELGAFGVNATVMAANLGVINAASSLLAELRDRGLGAPDVLVNNAGFGDYRSGKISRSGSGLQRLVRR
jgi:uncharacterized protein